ncbi:DUF397 domain-containing protein [Streptomyces sp. NPDC002537]
MSNAFGPSSAERSKSSYSSGESGMCVKWAPRPVAAYGLIPIRDSKNPHHHALAEDRISTG